jgi:hypothetical protein
VTVVVEFRSGDALGGSVTARFTPDRPTFHVYSTDLPIDGVDGLGRPTRLEVSSGVIATGAAATESPVRLLRPEGLDVDLPVYADGPVTLTLPVQRSDGSHDVSVAELRQLQRCVRVPRAYRTKASHGVTSRRLDVRGGSRGPRIFRFGWVWFGIFLLLPGDPIG